MFMACCGDTNDEYKVYIFIFLEYNNLWFINLYIAAQ